MKTSKNTPSSRSQTLRSQKRKKKSTKKNKHVSRKRRQRRSESKRKKQLQLKPFVRVVIRQQRKEKVKMRHLRSTQRSLTKRTPTD